MTHDETLQTVQSVQTLQGLQTLQASLQLLEHSKTKNLKSKISKLKLKI
jgi:hypothetical protein